jgi:microcin C transport system substrate-binding protein
MATHRKNPSRRAVLAGGVAATAAVGLPAPLRAQGVDWSKARHGLSSFGELALPADFPHFAYVNPQAPKGGVLSLQVTSTAGNQSFNTFNTFQIYILRGDGAAGIQSIFDSLMSGTGDEPDAMYGLVADRVLKTEEKPEWRFRLRPEARFHDGSRLTAEDVAFSIDTLKTRGHPVYQQILREVKAVEAESAGVVRVELADGHSRDMIMFVGTLPIFSKAYYATKNWDETTLESPLGSGAYKLSRFEVGRYVEFERVADYWGRDLPVNIGQNNFDRLRYEYFRDRTVAFEAFKGRAFLFREENTSRIWATGYDFPAVADGRVKREELPDGSAAPIQGWYFNTRLAKFSDRRVREAIGLCFDFEWTNQNVMFNSFRRTHSFFENTPMKAEGRPSPAEVMLLEPWRGKVPDEVFGEVFVPPVGDRSGSDRNLLRRASQLLREAGCRNEGGVLRLPNGQPLEIEFLDFEPSLHPHSQTLFRNLKLLGIEARHRTVDATQYQKRTDDFDFDVTTRAMGGTLTPGASLRVVYGSESADRKGSRNLTGTKSPAVDALIERISTAATRADMEVACRALDRVLRAERIWIPMWFKANDWFAYWDVYSRPATSPKFGTGAPGTWWYDTEKARRIGL